MKTCPICNKITDPNLTPFCSRRCADIDLHKWLGGVYALPAHEQDDEDGTKPEESTEYR